MKYFIMLRHMTIVSDYGAFRFLLLIYICFTGRLITWISRPMIMSARIVPQQVTIVHCMNQEAKCLWFVKVFPIFLSFINWLFLVFLSLIKAVQAYAI